MRNTKTTLEKILVIDGETDYICTLSDCYQHILGASNEEEVRIQLKENPDIKLVLLNNSIERFDHILKRITKDPKIKVLITSDQAENISEQEFVYKLDFESMKTAIDVQLNNYNTIAKDTKTAKSLLRQGIENLMGKGKVISAVIDKVEQYARIDEPLLIEGKTGTGKELIANYIYKLSGRKNMITINCSTIPKELANSELFGSVKGAFTDAQNKKGLIEAADGGILFLDEFNSLLHDCQAYLLRFIEYKTFTRAGDTVERKADVRIIVAGNVSFTESVMKGELRRDLYERFVKTLYIPTLQERIEDIGHFIDRFIVEENEKQGKTVIISNEARKLLADYDWTGNICQLKNRITMLVIETEPDNNRPKKCVIKPQAVREYFNEHYQNTLIDIPEDDYTLKTAYSVACDSAARKAIIQALTKTGAMSGLSGC
jgi:transcriptional regulator with PAS, ATPase and Fis domain